MTDIEQLRRLTTCALAFKEAATNYIKAEPGLEAQVIKAINIDDLDRVMKMAEILPPPKLGDSVHNASEKHLLAYIDAAEWTYEVSTRVMDKNALARFVPAELKTQTSVEELNQAGAPQLAALCKATL